MQRTPTSRRIFVALSGGVDSAVAALLLKNEGYDVTGVYMENWRKTKITPHCTTEEDRRDALRVAMHLDIPFRTVNFEREYEAHVIDYFYREYAAGRTPNPDVMCNREIKFGAFLRWAREQGADAIATGHYARIAEHDGVFQLLRGVDDNKDQSYFLHAITQDQLASTLFPIGELTKPEVRAKAKQLGLPVAEKRDSQGICFVGQVDVAELLKHRIPEKRGDIRTTTGKHVGEHIGLPFYTIGQRQGIGVGGSGIPYYVAKKEHATNTLVVAHGNSDASLYHRSLRASHAHWIGVAPFKAIECQVATRYRQPPQSAVLTPTSTSELQVDSTEPQRAITPGQSAVIYQGEVCLGGAVIEEAL